MAAPYAFAVPVDEEFVLNYCTKYLARGAKFFTDNQSPNAQSLTVIAENWRFPLVMPALTAGGSGGEVNEITFVWFAPASTATENVTVTGSFAPFFQSFPLQPVLFETRNIGIYACTLVAPIGQSYHYRFRKDGVDIPDPINPQRKTLDNGKEWSVFFTDYFNSSEEFEEWEVNIIRRLANQIIPFRTGEAQNFIDRFYLSLAKPDKLAIPIYRLDESVGEVNYITNILVREERHHLADYKICIHIIDQLLRLRNPFVDSWLVSEELIIDLYNEMATGNVPGWDYNRYNDPKYFLGVLRRHVITGAFSHPRHGGNIGGAGWSYLEERYAVKNDQAQISGTLFNWQLAMEAPLGVNADYKG